MQICSRDSKILNFLTFLTENKNWLFPNTFCSQNMSWMPCMNLQIGQRRLQWIFNTSLTDGISINSPNTYTPGASRAFCIRATTPVPRADFANNTYSSKLWLWLKLVFTSFSAMLHCKDTLQWKIVPYSFTQIKPVPLGVKQGQKMGYTSYIEGRREKGLDVKVVKNFFSLWMWNQ